MKALGIIAMILAIIAIFIPFLGPYLTVVCALIAAFSAGPGLTFGTVAIGLNLLNLTILSPTIWMMASEGVRGFQLLAIALVGIQVIAGIVLSIVHSKWSKRNDSVPT